MNVPFVVANGTKDPMRGYTSEFGDLLVPRFLLSETAATSQVFALWHSDSDWNDGDGKRDHIAAVL